MSACHKPRKRGENQKVVLDALLGADRPMTAYDLLAVLRDKGITAPPTVYRALDRLMAEGCVHRLETLNAYVACRNPDHGAVSIFMICDDCGAVEEIRDPGVEAGLATAAHTRQFSPGRNIIEMHGHCLHCTDGKAATADHTS